MLRPKQENFLPKLLAGVGIIMLAVYFLLRFHTTSSLSSSSSTLGESIISVEQTKPRPVHMVDKIVKASLFANSALKKPLELLTDSTEVSCPERGGKNTQCGKVFAEYRFQVDSPGQYYLYVQVKAPTLNDNSLWIGLADNKRFDEDKGCQGDLGPLVPHKHVSDSELVCCPKYLEKNRKKGLAGFYSDCCYDKLGKNSDEQGCVLDLEVESGPKWNRFPRSLDVEDAGEMGIKIFAREDGTSWTGLVLSNRPDLDDKQLAKMSKKSLMPNKDKNP